MSGYPCPRASAPSGRLSRRNCASILNSASRAASRRQTSAIRRDGQGRAKVELALAKGKKAHDKRETIKERDWKREQGRILRDRG